MRDHKSFYGSPSTDKLKAEIERLKTDLEAAHSSIEVIAAGMSKALDLGEGAVNRATLDVMVRRMAEMSERPREIAITAVRDRSDTLVS